MPLVGDSITIGNVGLPSRRGEAEIRIGNLRLWLTREDIEDLKRILAHALDNCERP